ncbi:LANO_0D07756g1_1 [Lachancea nothofagi CBS 11611]|uniref:Aspartate aminotransferase n=1 Tax=Lachancea nothofagi CBS 11611 TaxID=1266666 RepID=A0A1G4JI80_9SACH|nr:LANO_0D07756g1_1 [Lachancea nothofagi CBS 11611]
MSRTLFNDIDLLPPDSLFNIKQRLSQDSRPVKVDLGIGAYRDDNGKPWVLPSVREAEKVIQKDPSYNHEYLGIGGLTSLTQGAAKVLLGDDNKALKEKRVVSVQSLSGTGALHMAARFFTKFCGDKLVYLSDPTWANHNAIFETMGLKTATYPYWDPATKSLNLKGYLSAIESAPKGSIFVLHACAHNPTGLDPNQEQWASILDAIIKKDHIVLFDSAYQGFASGDLDRDAFAVRLGLEKLAEVSPIFICQSFAKNVGMYGERAGCFHIVLPRQDQSVSIENVKDAINSQLAKITRSELSNPPAYGAKIVSTVLNDEQLTEQWHKDMVTMSSRIIKMRHQLRDNLVKLHTPGNWDHIVGQTGMFSYTGLSPEMVKRLEKEHAVYLVGSGRASIAGLNSGNVEYVAKAINEVVNHFSNSKL